MDGPLRVGEAEKRVSHAVWPSIIVHPCKDEVVRVYLCACVHVA